jgi:hypothetical protein
MSQYGVPKDVRKRILNHGGSRKGSITEASTIAMSMTALAERQRNETLEANDLENCGGAESGPGIIALAVIFAVG